MINCFFTNDVEHVSINGCMFERMADEIDQNTLPRLLDVYEKYNVHSTFFILASLAEIRPNIVRQIADRGQEVASHGYCHDYRKAYDLLTLEQQKTDLKRSKDILEQIAGKEVVSFRAPALRVNEFTPQALEETGFRFDSSVAPQRLDAFMSLGSKKKRAWYRAPRAIYNTAIDNLARRGDSSIIEVPVSSFGIPYIGTVMRLSPYFLNAITRQLLCWEVRSTQKPINFLFHPSEAVKEIKEEYTAIHRSNSWLGHLFSDVLRANIKKRNLNMHALDLLEHELKYWQKRDARFMCVNEVKVNSN